MPVTLADFVRILHSRASIAHRRVAHTETGQIFICNTTHSGILPPSPPSHVCQTERAASGQAPPRHWYRAMRCRPPLSAVLVSLPFLVFSYCFSDLLLRTVSRWPAGAAAKVSNVGATKGAKAKPKAGKAGKAGNKNKRAATPPTPATPPAEPELPPLSEYQSGASHFPLSSTSWGTLVSG